MRLLAFCEAEADFRLVSGLIDRVFRETGPSWVVDNFEQPESVRTWRPDVFGRRYFDIHKLLDYENVLVDKGYVDLRAVRARGRFIEDRRGTGSAMARKAFLIARAIQDKLDNEPLDAVVFIWDIDQRSEHRATGVKIARDEARAWASFRIVCGFPDPEREAWILAGFEPCNKDEQGLLDEVQSALTFSPVHEAHRLRDKNSGAHRDIKRVLRHLIGEDNIREEKCWTDPSLDLLRSRGRLSGLTDFLEEVRAVLIPALDPGSAWRKR